MTLEDNLNVKLLIWDTFTNEKYLSTNQKLLAGTDGALICFDLTRKLEKADFDRWKNSVTEQEGSKCFTVVVGTKSDLEVSKETREDLKTYAQMIGAPYVETSALIGKNVEEAFHALMNDAFLDEMRQKWEFEKKRLHLLENERRVVSSKDRQGKCNII